MRPTTNTTNYKNLTYLLIPTFVLILAWIAFSIYGSRVKSTITDVQSKQIRPISSTFDLATLEKIKTRQLVTPILTFIPLSTSSDEQSSESAQTPPPLQPIDTPQASDASELQGGTP